MHDRGYYHGNDCDANVRQRHPDGGERPCAKTGAHARLREVAWSYTGLGRPLLGPFRFFFCDQHVAEHDAGLNVFDPERPRMPKVAR